MKSKAIIVLILSISLTLVSCTFWISFGLSKPKPNPNSNPELIIFEGDLNGEQEVCGCCPNAGPFPEYTMTLSEVFNDVLPEAMIDVALDGNIFMNVFMDLSSKGHGKEKSYIVQFWWDDGDYFIEIRGGDIEENKKTKTLIVTFDEAPCEIWINDLLLPEPLPVTFTLTRAPL